MTTASGRETALDDLCTAFSALLNYKRALAVLTLISLTPVALGVGTEDLEIRDIILTTGIPSAYVRTASEVLVLDDTGQRWRRLPGTYSDVAVDPISPNRVLLVSDGEVFASTDSGMTRARVSPPESIVGVRFSRDATRVYATASSQPAHLYRSNNSGVSWTRGADILSYNTRFPAGAIHVNPWDANRMIVTIGPIGAAITEDGGDHWRNLLIGDPYGFAFSPPGTAGIWAATSSGLQFSTDSGLSWTHSMLTGATDRVWIDPSGPSVIYALHRGTEVSRELYRSEDGGAQFSRINIPAGVTSVNVLAFDPLMIGRIFMGGINGIWTSDDAGVTWSQDNREIYDAPTSAPIDPRGNGGGGGAFSWSMLLALTSFAIGRGLWIQRRHSLRRCAYRSLPSLIAWSAKSS